MSASSALPNPENPMERFQELCDDDENLCYPVIFYRNQLSFFSFEGDNLPHTFGGPFPTSMNMPEDAILHSLLTIQTDHCAVLQNVQLPTLPLLFPFRHDAGRLAYTITPGNEIDIVTLEPPKSTKDWPYRNYPALFPSKAMASSPAFECSWEAFNRLSLQGNLPESLDYAMILVPPSRAYGVSLWGQAGDAEQVQCIFIVNMMTGQVMARNECT